MFPITDDLLTRASDLPYDAIRKLVESGVIEAENAGELGRAKRRRWQGHTVADCAHIAALRKGGLSLFQAASVRALGGSTWRAPFMSMVSHPKDESEVTKLLKAEPRERREDLRVEIVDGQFVYERRGGPERDLIAQLVDGGTVLAPKERRPRVAEFVADGNVNNLPIEFGALALSHAAKQSAQPVSATIVNLDLAARLANKKLLAELGFSDI